MNYTKNSEKRPPCYVLYCNSFFVVGRYAAIRDWQHWIQEIIETGRLKVLLGDKAAETINPSITCGWTESYSCAASTAKSCAPCGTYVIPYPLSTEPNCGDPMYSKFNCDYTKGQVSFMMSGGKSYRVTWIDEGARKFYIQTNDSDSDHCDSSSSYQSYKPSSPFNVTNWCFKDEIEVTWLPAPQPTCNKSRDCNHWLHSTCTPSNTEGVRRCLCNSNYLWNTSSYSCIQG